MGKVPVRRDAVAYLWGIARGAEAWHVRALAPLDRASSDSPLPERRLFADVDDPIGSPRVIFPTHPK
jgi:hypothetical protein